MQLFSSQLEIIYIFYSHTKSCSISLYVLVEYFPIDDTTETTNISMDKTSIILECAIMYIGILHWFTDSITNERKIGVTERSSIELY